jgi:nitrate reductase gamma subunit
MLMLGAGIMLQDLRHANAIPVRSSTQVRDHLKVIALLALVLLGLLALVLNKVEIAGDPEYPTAFYSL